MKTIGEIIDENITSDEYGMEINYTTIAREICKEIEKMFIHNYDLRTDEYKFKAKKWQEFEKANGVGE